ncbi:MAG: hypothetical protein V1783_06175 [Bacteroidota bacterium]|jgi:hypothetical protein
MIKLKPKFFLLLSLLFGVLNAIEAQINLHSYFDIGETNVSEGIYIKNAYHGSYQLQNYNFEAGMQFDLRSNNPNTFSAIDVMAARQFRIKEFPIKVQAFFMLNRFSDLMQETNWGIRAGNEKQKHFVYSFGMNFKTYKFNKTYREENNFSRDESRLSENFNLVYLFSAYFKPIENDWNIGLSLTNTDYFLINQTTNPMINVQLKYKVKSNLLFYTEAWYKQAGVFNIYANYFGYFIRGGVKWEI